MPVAFQALKDLARERSQEKRHELVRAVTEKFFSASVHSQTEIDLFDEIMDMVLAEIEPLARQELAVRIADLDQAPRRTLLKLADDEIEIAGPILKRSPVLNDDDLEPIAREQTQSHLMAIAQRETLSERLTDILIVRGNDIVTGTVTANDGARFSPAGFNQLAQRAETSDVILDRLMARRDIPERVATELMPRLRSLIKAKVGVLNVDFEADMTNALAGAARDQLANRLRSTARTSRPLTVLTELIDRGTLSFSEAVIELSDADQTADLAILIGMKLGLRSGTVVRNLFGAGEEALMLICRAAGLELEAFSAILRMRNRRKRKTPLNPVQFLKDYLRIPREVADSVMKSVRAREHLQGMN